MSLAARDTDERTETRAFRRLHEIAVAASGVLEPEPLAQLVVDAACDLLGVEAAVLRWREAGGMRLLASNDRHRVEIELGPEDDVVGELLESSRPLRVDDYQEWSLDKPSLRRPGAHAALYVSLVVRDRRMGGLGVISYRPRKFGEEDERLLTLLAAQVAPSIDAARFHAEVERRARRQEELADFGRRALNALGAEELLTDAVKLAMECLPIDGAGVLELNEDATTLTLRAGAPDESLVGVLTVPVTAASSMGYTLQVGTPLVLSEDDPDERRRPSPLLREYGIKSCLSVVVRLPGKPYGVFAATSTTPVRFGSEDISFVGQIANVLGEAIERQRVEGRLRAAEETQRLGAEIMREAVNSLSAFISMRDLDGNVLFANRAYATFFGITPEEMQGRNLSEFWTPAAVKRTLAEDRRASRTGKPVQLGQVAFEALDGRIKHLSASRFPIRLGTGQAGVLVVAEDFDYRVQVEAARRESEAKSRFLATMSHELRTPLNSVLGFSQLLQQETVGPLTDRQRRYVDHVMSSGRHLLELINDVLDLSKVQAGRMELKPVEVVVAGALKDTAARVFPQAEARKLELQVKPEAGLKVRADRRRLDQVLWNLLSNAIRFTPEGGTVTLRSRREDDQVVIEVADTGVGIPKEMHERIFEEFTQVDSGSRRSWDGTGLGLSLTRLLVREMGGTISLQSTPGKGSVFSVRLRSD